jgi:hypothetical protein
MSQSVCPSLKGPKLQDGGSNILGITTLQNKLIYLFNKFLLLNNLSMDFKFTRSLVLKIEV